MNKLDLYHKALDAVLFLRDFMRIENCYDRGFEDALKAFGKSLEPHITRLIDECLKSKQYDTVVRFG